LLLGTGRSGPICCRRLAGLEVEEVRHGQAVTGNNRILSLLAVQNAQCKGGRKGISRLGGHEVLSCLFAHPCISRHLTRGTARKRAWPKL
jgi:hypothetical protein